MKALKWLLAIVLYHPLMFLFVILTPFMPFILYGQLKNILIYEVPSSSVYVTALSFMAFLVYLAIKSRFLGIPYRKITILLPLMQMFIYTSVALSIGIIILNKWADEGLYSKGWAITLMLIAIVVIRLGVSWLYWKQPIVKRVNQNVEEWGKRS